MAAPAPRLSEDAALSLAVAVVEASPGPLILLDGDLIVIGASRSFCEAFEVDPATARGAALTQLGAGEWRQPPLETLLAESQSGAPTPGVCDLTLRRPGLGDRQLIIHAERLEYFDLEHARIMVAVFDVTQARAQALAMAEAEAHNLVLLREVRHRVANSLQIVASLLLQDARKAQSDEAKTRLAEAHNRVMSIAALERQLAGVGDSGVEVKAYFTSLCATIAASIVGDPEQIVIAVTGPGGAVEPRVSLSLGLIVTELVINALKHAFPQGRHGTITVECAFPGPNWTLSVTDDGVGVPTDRRDARTGLGTSIVQALARELGATIETTPAHPGNRVTVARTAVALVAKPEPEPKGPFASSIPGDSRPAA